MEGKLFRPCDYDVTQLVHKDTYPAISPLSIPPLNKAVFVVGASKGISLAIAKAFAHAGASHIAIGARSPLSSVKDAVLQAAADAKRAVPQVVEVKIDVTSQESTEDAAALVEKEFGKLDILLINAGILGKPALITESDPDTWWETWNVNLKGPYLVSRAFLPLMLKGGDKTIVTTASVGAHVKSPALSAYQPSKLAVLSGDTLVFLTKERREWLGGRYINCTWDMPELMAKEDEIVKGDKLKVRLVF